MSKERDETQNSESLDEKTTHLEDERLAQALRATRDTVYDWNLATGIVWRSIPHSADDPQARSTETGPELWALAIHPSDRPRVMTALERTFRDRQPFWSGRYQCTRPDGSQVAVWDRAHVSYDPHGTPQRMRGTLTDVLLYEEVVEKLRVSEARHRALVEAASDAVWVVNATVRAETDDAVQWWLDLTGQSAAEAAGWGWLDKVHPDDRKRVQELWTRTFEHGTSYEADYRVLSRHGDYRDVLVRGVPVRGSDNAIREWVGMFTDVTARRRTEAALLRSEERFRAFMDNSPAAASIVDVDGRVVYVSEGFRRMFRLPPGEPSGRTLFELFSPEVARLWLDAGCQAILADAPLEAIEPGVRADGTDGVFLTYRFPLHETGETRLVGGVAADITELRRLEDQLRQVQKMEAVGQLARGVAHDFNNVLTVIQGFSDLVLSELPPDHELAQPVSEIKRAGERAAQLTGQLLAFSRKAVVRPILLDLNAVVSDSENMLRRLVGEDIDVSYVLEPKLWRVKADPIQIDQLLLNLVSNARDAMPQGGSLTLETRNALVGSQAAERRQNLPAGNYVSLSVTDTGCGMEPATMDRIFEPFFTTKPPGKGTGMGLAAVYGIVQQLGGHIKVQSQPGIGTSFSIYLPPRLELVVEEPAAAELAPAPRGQETVLLVEDDDSVRALSQKVLVRQGYVVLEASNGIEALRVSDEYAGTIDVLVTDVVMPYMSGSQLADRLRQSRPSIKVLFVSGYPDEALGAHGVLDPAVTFLPKPFMPSALASKVRSVLDTPS
jgi:two-component system, cell cycle sensor histidine kinase and response regulator CckA